MTAKENLPRYQPVSDTGNGHRVRPDFQTKVVGAIVIAIILYMGKSIADKVDTFGERITRIETKVDERFGSLIKELGELKEEVKALKNAK